MPDGGTIRIHAENISRQSNGLPVLLTSGYSEVAKQAADAQGIAILRKPYQLGDLSAALKAAMSDGHIL
jgi:hypothetical protein